MSETPDAARRSAPDLSPLDEAGVSAAVDAALAEIAAAVDLDALKSVRLAHTGDRSPLALANRAIGGLAAADNLLNALGFER